MNILFSVLTVLVLIGIGYFLSDNKKAINWRTIGSGLLTQIVLMFIVLKTSIGQALLKGTSQVVLQILNFSKDGIDFVFGGMSPNFVFAINVLAVICYTGALISVLYYLRVIPFLVKIIGGMVSKIMGTTKVESFCGVGNAFLSATESPLLTKPYLKDLTKSEIFAVMVGGFGSVSVSAILGYVAMGLNMEFILVQMVTVPFATLMMAKLLVPETEESITNEITVEKSEHPNIFGAIGSGALDGMQIAMSVGAVLIGFISIIALLNYVLGFVGISLTDIFTVILTPLAWLLNIPHNEIASFTNAIGLKISVNEYVAISSLTPVVHGLSMRTQAILTLALVNFANFSVIGITIGGFNSFCPEKSEIVTKLGFKAMIGGVLTTLISGALIGMFF